MRNIATAYYVIRHKPTGRLLPARVPATYYDFDRPDEALEPRLFHTQRAANNCATCWAQGAWVQQERTKQEGWEMPSYTYLAEAIPEAVPGRKREDLEVVVAHLTLLT